MLKIENAKKAFGNNLLFQALNLEINQPGLYAITGKSGCGKTTLLSIMAGFDTFTEGSLSIDENTAFIFQNYELINELTIQNNILLSRRAFSEQENLLIEKLGLTNLLSYYPKELSGGQRQRVGIARALLRQPNIILCDEPTESLDIENKIIVMDLLKEISQQKIVIVVTHDLVTINEYADVVYVMENQNIQLKKNEAKTGTLLMGQKQATSIKDIKWLVHQITWKKSIFFTVSFLLLFSLWSSLFVYQQSMFKEVTTKQVLNKDMLYIKTDYDQEHISSLLEVKAIQIEPIFEFEHINLNNVEYNCMIYPYQNPDNIVIQGELPEGTNVIANQLALKELNLSVGDSLPLIYNVSGSYFEIESKIVGSINETDAFGMALYYDLDSLMELSKSQYTNAGMPLYDYLINFKGRHYQMQRGNQTIEEWMNKSKSFQRVEMSNPLFDYRASLKENNAVFKLVYELSEMILLAGIVFYMLLFLMKEVKHHQKNCSILSTMGISFTQVKQYYLVEKVLSFYPLSLLLPIIGIVLWAMNLIESVHLLLMLGLFIGFWILYIVLLWLFTRGWKAQQISSIIKEE